MDNAIGTDMKAMYEKVVLVSKDLNLRLLSQGEGLDAEDYENDKIPIKLSILVSDTLGKLNLSKYLQSRD